jgi:hypothetical protein
MWMALVSVPQKYWMNVSRVTASGGPIIRRIHRIWHYQLFSISFCFVSFIKRQLKRMHFQDGKCSDVKSGEFY